MMKARNASEREIGSASFTRSVTVSFCRVE
jgi:hypothetical protein